MSAKVIYAFLIVLSVALIFGAWAFVIEPSRIVYRQQTIHLDGWPAEWAGLKIAFLSDIHAGAPDVPLSKLETIVAQTNAQQPDLVLLGGDYVIEGVIGGAAVKPEDIFALFNGFKAPLGVYAVLGNHEWWVGDKRLSKNERYAAIVKTFKAHAPSLRLLEDEAVVLRRGENKLTLVGISDFNEGPSDYARALQGAGDLVIAFTHSPDVFPLLPAKIRLTLAGHTHGGQVYLPFIGRPIVPSRYKERYALGVVEEKGRTLFVSAGVGTSILPVRFLTPPEVNLLTIYPRPRKPDEVRG